MGKGVFIMKDEGYKVEGPGVVGGTQAEERTEGSQVVGSGGEEAGVYKVG